MGNSINGVNVLNSSMHFENYNLQLGSHSSVSVIRNGDYNWTVLYKVEGSECKLDLNCKCLESCVIHIRDDLLFLPPLVIFVFPLAETNLVMLNCFDFLDVQVESGTPLFTKKTKRTILGSVLETTVYLYGKGSKGGLVVLESNKKSGDEKPYLVTLAHYYAYASGDFFDYKRKTIGLSVITKVRASNDTGRLDITVEGPAQHPATALFQMFEEVRKTGIWKPTTCPHCANIQKQHVARYGMSSQSDSEDNDNPILPPRLCAPNQSVGSTANNNGAFRGNLNGSFVKIKRGIFF